MKNVRKIRKLTTRYSPLATHRLPPTPAVLDGIAERYWKTLRHAETLKKALLHLCCTHGFRPPDAPKTKMLAGELYEVLASRATRTVVHQRRLAALRSKLYGQNLRRYARALVRARIVYDVAKGAERAVLAMPAWVRLRFADAIESRPAGTRLTVRKRKLQSSRVVKSQRRKAA